MSKFKMFKLGSVAGVALAAAIAGASGTAQAVVACSTVSTLDGWESCEIGDKIFTKVSETFSTNPLVNFSSFGLDYTFFIDFGIATGLTAGHYDLLYTVKVTDPNAKIVKVSVDSNVQPDTGGTTVKKTLSDISGPLGSITSTNGSKDAIDGLSTQLLTVDEDFDVFGNQKLVGASNSFTQAVPEPATLGILGLGLIGLGLVRRRMAKKA